MSNITMKRLVAVIYVLVAGCMWGCMGVLVRMMGKINLTSMEIVFLRSAVTLIAMIIFLLVKGRGCFYVKIKDLWCFVGTGAFSIAFFNYCYFKTIVYTSLSVAAILLYTSPVFILMMSAILFKERITINKVIAVVFAMVGCAFVIGLVGGESSLSPMGILCGIGAGFGYALYSVFGRYALNKGYSSLTITLYTFVFSTISTFFMTSFVEIITKMESVSSILIGTYMDGGVGGDKTALMLAVVVLLILWVTMFPYLLYTKGLSLLDNGTASVVAAVEPVVATLIGIIIYKEEINLYIFVGIGLVLASIILINRKE